MARYEHLPIYKQALDFNVYLDRTVRHFSRYHKYSIGTALRENATDIMGLIIRANSTVRRAPVLEELRIKIEESKALFHLAKEIKAFPNFNSFVHGSKVLVELAKQTEGWIKFQMRQQPQRSGV